MQKINFSTNQPASVLFSTLKESDLSGKLIILTCNGKTSHVLMFESTKTHVNGRDGFIFRNVDNPQYGHSGHFDNRLQAIRRAMEISGNQEIFLFDSMAELLVSRQAANLKKGD